LGKKGELTSVRKSRYGGGSKKTYPNHGRWPRAREAFLNEEPGAQVLRKKQRGEIHKPA